MAIIEICLDSVAGVRAAVEAGAARVELCSALLEGGLTPTPGMIERAVEAAAGRVKVHVIIRPRGGDFLYDADEFAVMERDIDAAKAAGADGVVIGILNADASIDRVRTAALIARARPLSVTFHRAFDVSRDPLGSLDMLIDLGIDRLLSSGQEPSVLQGAPLIRDLITRADGRIVIMPGGDITDRNVTRILAETGAREIHFAAFETAPSGMQWRNEAVFMGGTLRPPEYDRAVTTVHSIRAVIGAVTR
jgi:copper homeostasis protein